MESKTKEKHCWVTWIYIQPYILRQWRKQCRRSVWSHNINTSQYRFKYFFSHVINFTHGEIEHVGSSGKAYGLFGKCQVRILAAKLHFMRDFCRISQIAPANDGIRPDLHTTFLLKPFQLTSHTHTQARTHKHTHTHTYIYI